MRKLALAAAFACLSLGSIQAQAVLIDFDSHASTTLTGGTPPASAVVTDDFAAQGVVFGRTGVSAGVAVVNNSSAFSLPNGACGLDAAGDITPICSGDIHFRFESGGSAATTNSVSFVVGDGGGDLDSWAISIFDVNDVLLATQVVAGTAHQNVSFSQAGIHRVFIDWTAPITSGYLLDNLEFASVTQVPEPVTLMLIAVALAGLGLGRRKLAAQGAQDASGVARG